MKSARFTELVKAAGEPEPYTLWLPPEKDQAFQKALKEHRVLSVHQETVGTHADYGTVGYAKDKHAQILVFPKSIETFAGKKIVGVKYELLKAAAPAEPIKAETRQEKAVKKESDESPKVDRKASKSAPRSRTDSSREKEPSPGKTPEQEVAAEPGPNRETLLGGIRKAMELLDQGKVVAAYRTLEKASQPGK